MLSAHPTRLLYRCSVCVCSGDAWIMYHAVFNPCPGQGCPLLPGFASVSRPAHTVQCCSSLFLRDQIMDSHHVRSVRYDFCIPLRVLHYFKLLICTLGTDVNIKNSLLLQTWCVWGFFFFFFLSWEINHFNVLQWQITLMFYFNNAD